MRGQLSITGHLAISNGRCTQDFSIYDAAASSIGFASSMVDLARGRSGLAAGPRLM